MWMGEIEKYAAPNVNKILIGNKSDLTHERKISYDLGYSLAKEYKIKFMETSAKSSSNVMESFKEVAK